MTMMTYHETERERTSPLAGFFGSIIELPARLHREWRRRQTEKMLEALPREIRKDIGWPASDTNAGGR